MQYVLPFRCCVHPFRCHQFVYQPAAVTTTHRCPWHKITSSNSFFNVTTVFALTFLLLLPVTVNGCTVEFTRMTIFLGWTTPRATKLRRLPLFDKFGRHCNITANNSRLSFPNGLSTLFKNKDSPSVCLRQLTGPLSPFCLIIQRIPLNSK